jgi:hypothetical protein
MSKSQSKKKSGENTSLQGSPKGHDSDHKPGRSTKKNFRSRTNTSGNIVEQALILENVRLKGELDGVRAYAESLKSQPSDALGDDVVESAPKEPSAKDLLAKRREERDLSGDHAVYDERNLIAEVLDSGEVHDWNDGQVRYDKFLNRLYNEEGKVVPDILETTLLLCNIRRTDYPLLLSGYVPPCWSGDSTPSRLFNKYLADRYYNVLKVQIRAFVTTRLNMSDVRPRYDRDEPFIDETFVVLQPFILVTLRDGFEIYQTDLGDQPYSFFRFLGIGEGDGTHRGQFCRFPVEILRIDASTRGMLMTGNYAVRQTIFLYRTYVVSAVMLVELYQRRTQLVPKYETNVAVSRLIRIYGEDAAANPCLALRLRHGRSVLSDTLELSIVAVTCDYFTPTPDF